MRKLASLALGALALSAASPASAGLVLFQSYVGQYGLSTDGGGSNGGDYIVSASVPFGATVTGAYLYQATNNNNGLNAPITFNGTSVTFGAPSVNDTACCDLASARADVTSLVASVIDGGLGGVYDFTIGEGDTISTDGTALVVVYSLSSLAESTVAILDGWASVTGDTTFINFADPLDPTDPGFVADMRLGIGFSCCGSQHSTVNVNGALMTEFAGNFDDGASENNGSLITVGSFDDPFSPALPGYDTDTERYDLAPFISSGDTQIRLDTFNTSEDDNIFLLAGIFSGIAGINEPPPTGAVPEPATWLMLILGFMGIGGAMRAQKRSEKIAVRYA